MIPVPFTEPLEKGGLSCGDCGELLTHDDFIGRHKGISFTVMGYNCPHCGNKYEDPKYKPKTKHGKGRFMEPFSWMRIAGTRGTSSQGFMGSPFEQGVVIV